MTVTLSLQRDNSVPLGLLSRLVAFVCIAVEHFDVMTEEQIMYKKDIEAKIVARNHFWNAYVVEFCHL
jgi:hypothetical protein